MNEPKQIKVLLDALRQFSECKLTDENCASLEVVNKRIRNIARIALTKYEEASNQIAALDSSHAAKIQEYIALLARDREAVHSECDGELVALLRHLGCNETAKAYEEAQQLFYYA